MQGTFSRQTDKDCFSTTKMATNRTKHASTKESKYVQDSTTFRIVHYMALPVFLMIFVPNLTMVLWYVERHCSGSFTEFFSRIGHNKLLDLLSLARTEGAIKVLEALWTPMVTGWGLAVVSAMFAWAILMTKFLPAGEAYGPVTSTGHRPTYPDNGLTYCFVSFLTLVIVTVVMKAQSISPTVVIDRFDELLRVLSLFSFVFCAWLCYKGLNYPSSGDHGRTDNPVFDYYWGTELYPRLPGDIDVKQVVICRFSMMVWAVTAILAALKNYELNDKIVDSVWLSGFLLVTYLVKFYYWEIGYMHTTDIQTDRCGWYLCYGCLAYVPAMYTLTSRYLAYQAKPIGLPATICLLCLGLACILVNYQADEQKTRARQSDGRCLIWGAPVRVLRATHRGPDGAQRTSLLLASGFWGWARHFHYVPELAAALCWSLPAGGDALLPYAYVIYLTILLVHRSFRDDWKCQEKYGKAWTEYCKLVPYRMIPYVF